MGFYETVLQHLPCRLVTVLETRGSVPRGPGAAMALWQDGQVGTIGGGALEKMAADTAMAMKDGEADRTEVFSLTAEDAKKLGMVCGGEAKVLLQGITEAHRPLLQKLAQCEEEGTAAWIVRGASGQMQVAYTPEADREQTVIPAVRGGRAILFGGGHVSLALVQLLQLLCIPTVVWDDRPEFANTRRFPHARCICAPFDRIAEVLPLLPTDLCIVMTRGHEADTAVLRQVLCRKAAYHGCIGSRKKLEICRKTLLAEGLPQADWDKLHAPIGLDIGARTPQEIAVAIAAQIIAVRNGKA